MTDDRGKPWYQQLPARLAAVVVFLVALTTLAGNLMELAAKRRLAVEPEKPVAPLATTGPQAPSASDRLRLQLDRIAVEHDGSPGTTDWRFTVQVDGEPLFAFQQDGMDDTGGRNVSVPESADAALRLAPERRARITVHGWRGSRFRLPGGAPDASGDGVLDGAGTAATIRVVAPDPDAGAFVFYFSGTRE